MEGTRGLAAAEKSNASKSQTDFVSGKRDLVHTGASLGCLVMVGWEMGGGRSPLSLSSLILDPNGS